MIPPVDESENRKLVRQAEIYDGQCSDMRYQHTSVVYTDGEQLFSARTSLRLGETKECLSELHGHPIPKERIYPKAEGENFTWMTEETSKSCYVKYPGVLDWEKEKDSTSDPWKDLLLREARFGEILGRSPHPNVATYLGCVRDDRWILGVCFAKCKKNLWDRIIVDKDTSLARPDLLEAVLAGIRNGIEHIHSLGYCHNDVNATNIMFDDNNTPIIIDFETCCPEGEELTLKRGMVGWYDESSKHSCRKNDYYGLQKIEEFINKKRN